MLGHCDTGLICHGDIEPLTGLLPREAFDDQVATLIGARSR